MDGARRVCWLPSSVVFREKRSEPTATATSPLDILISYANLSPDIA